MAHLEYVVGSADARPHGPPSVVVSSYFCVSAKKERKQTTQGRDGRTVVAGYFFFRVGSGWGGVARVGVGRGCGVGWGCRGGEWVGAGVGVVV